MKKHILLLRLSYWSAAIADFGIAVLVLIPERMAVSEIEYPMGLLSAIAFSWGILLLAADRRPMERRWILIPTILVVGLLTLVRVIFTLDNTIAFNPGFLLLGMYLVTLMSFSYYYAGRALKAGPL